MSSSSDAARLDRIDGLIAAHAGRSGALLPILHAIQDAFAYVPADAVPRIAQALHLSRAEVHGVVSFYHFFRTHPPGQHVVQLCRAEACQAMHGARTEAAARRELGIDFGATSADGAFTLEAVYCLGNCAAGPSAMVDGTLYGRVTPERLEEILARCRVSR